jgi:hypothetical protein
MIASLLKKAHQKLKLFLWRQRPLLFLTDKVVKVLQANFQAIPFQNL